MLRELLEGLAVSHIFRRSANACYLLCLAQNTHSASMLTHIACPAYFDTTWRSESRKAVEELATDARFGISAFSGVCFYMASVDACFSQVSVFTRAKGCRNTAPLIADRMHVPVATGR